MKLQITTAANGNLIYKLEANKKVLIENSSLGFDVGGGAVIPSSQWTVKDKSYNKIRSEWKPVWGKRAIVPDCFNELVLDLEGNIDAPLHEFQIIVRAYDDCVAFRYVVPFGSDQEVVVNSELTTFNFTGDYVAWFYNKENHNIGPEKLSDSKGERMPVMTIKATDDCYLAIHEADLLDGQPFLLSSKKRSKEFSVVSKPRKLYSGYKSAWRTILYGKTPGALVDSHTLELLNPDPAPNSDFSWVKPGVAVWDWRMNGAIVGDFTYSMSYPSWVRMVDFASEQGFPHLVLDADWYGPEHQADSNPVTGDKANDVRKIIQYARERGVGVWLYLNDVGGRKYPIEETLKQYGEWGASGVKYGFMRGSLEEKNIWTQKITALCAENKLLVNFHDNPVHSYGQMRTWPNAVTREYCQAQLDGHKVFKPKTFVTSVFVNMIAGPIDMNNGMFDLRQGKTTRVDENKPVPSTLVSEAARTLIVFSGATVIPDIPEFYRKYPPLLEFLAAQKMPWVESKTLAGEIGEYIVMMRQTKDAILVAAATNESSRNIDLPLSFLGKGTYDVQIIQDGVGAHYLTNRETLRIDNREVTSNDKLRLELASGGGACLLFRFLE
ncbi:glycoside hydrolase family 97 protein [Dysgonomonas sp. 216]|nr:glycoside hydrolase family 97 protein [Dysgonomonas sp. 216]